MVRFIGTPSGRFLQGWRKTTETCEERAELHRAQDRNPGCYSSDFTDDETCSLRGFILLTASKQKHKHTHTRKCSLTLISPPGGRLWRTLHVPPALFLPRLLLWKLLLFFKENAEKNQTEFTLLLHHVVSSAPNQLKLLKTHIAGQKHFIPLIYRSCGGV